MEGQEQQGEAGEYAYDGGVSGLAPTLGGLEAEGYYTEPPIEDLTRMTEEELAAVPNFTVTRPGHGTVVWLEPVDLRGIDLSRVLCIADTRIFVYRHAEVPDECMPDRIDAMLPPVGEGLNKSAFVSLCGINNDESTSGMGLEEFVAKLRDGITNLGAEFQSYDETCCTVEVYVPSFEIQL